MSVYISNQPAMPPTLVPAKMLVWLRADVGVYTNSSLSTPAVNDGDNVCGWKDQSGNSYNFLDATGTHYGTLKTNQQNGLPAIRSYNGNPVSTALFTGTLPTYGQAWTVFCVYKSTAGFTGYVLTNFQNVVSSAQFSFFEYATGSAIESTSFNKPTKSVPLSFPSNVSTAFNIYSARLNAGSSFGQVNLNKPQTGAVDSYDPLNSGYATNTLRITNGTFDIAEIIIYQAAVSNVAINQVVQYFQTKYNLP